MNTIKARVDFVPKTRLRYKIFLKRIYIFDKDSLSVSEYKYLILNPNTEQDDDSSHNRSHSYIG